MSTHDNVVAPRPTKGHSHPLWLRVATLGGASLLISALITFSYYSARSVKQFMRADSLNEFLPYLREYSRLLFSGQSPTLTTQSFSGGNYLVDFHRTALNVSEFVGVVAWRFTSDIRQVALAMAFISVLLLFLGSYFLGRNFLGRLYSYLFAITVTTLPVIHGFYIGNWWNAAGGMIAFVWLLAAMMWCCQQPSVWKLPAIFVCTWLVFTSGWPHSMAALAITVIITLIWYLISRKLGVTVLSWHWVTLIGVAGFAGFLAAIPAAMEFLKLSSYMARESEFANGSNFGVPSIGQLLSVMNPIGYDFWNYFGYDWWPVAIGFVSLAVVALPLVVPRLSERVRRDPFLWLTVALTIAFLLSTQLPSQLGPLRWPFRFVAYYVIAAAAILFRLLDGATFKWTKTRWLVSTGGFSLFVVWSLARTGGDDWAPLIQLALIGMILVLSVLGILYLMRYPVCRNGAIVALVVLGIATTIIAPSPTQTKITTGTLPATAVAEQLKQLAAGGYLLDATSGKNSPGINSHLHAGRYLLYDIALLNGYDPNVQKPFSDLLGKHGSRGFLNPDAAEAVLQPSLVDSNKCVSSILKISAIILPNKSVSKLTDQLADCGFTRSSMRKNKATVFTAPVSPALPTTLSYSAGVNVSDIQASNQTESMQISNTSGSSKQLVFSRMYWPGYKATLDGKPLTVTSAESGIVVAVNIPAGAEGKLTLQYATQTLPTSWFVLGGLGLLLLIVAMAVASGWKRRNKPEYVIGTGMFQVENERQSL